MMQKKKKHFRIFDKSIQDSSTITYTVDSAILLGIAMWFFGFLLLPLLTWFPNSYLPLPPDILMKTVQDDIQRTTTTVPLTLTYAYHIEYWIMLILHKWSGGLFFPIAAKDYSTYLQGLMQQGIAQEITSRYVFATYGSWVAGALGVYLGFAKIDPDRQVRGRRLLEGEEAIREMATVSKALEIPKKGFVRQMRDKLTGKHITEEELLKELVRLGPGVPLSREIVTKHIMIMGAIGGGKTVIIRYIILQIIKLNQRALISDIKGDMVTSYPSAHILSPFIEDSLVLSISRLLRNKELAKTFADYLIPESKDSPMWAQSARAVFVGFVVFLNATRGTHWGYKEILQCFKMEDDQLFDIMNVYNPQASKSVKEANVTTTGIMINLQSCVGPLYDLFEAWHDKTPNFDLVQWLRNDNSSKRQIIMVGDGQYETTSRGFFSAIFAVINATIKSPRFGESKTRKLWFIMDEFTQYGKLNIDALITLGRSKGIRVILGFQDRSQLDAIYTPEIAKTWIASVGVKIFVKTNEGETAKWICDDMIGKIEIERSNWSIAMQDQGGISKTYMSSNVKDISLIQPEELQALLGNKPDKGGVDVGVIGIGTNFNVITIPYPPEVKDPRKIDYADWMDRRLPAYAGLEPIVLPTKAQAIEQAPEAVQNGEQPPEGYEQEYTQEELDEYPPSVQEVYATVVQKIAKKPEGEEAEASPMEELGADMLVSSSHLSHLVLPTMEVITALGKKPPSAKMTTEVKMTSSAK